MSVYKINLKRRMGRGHWDKDKQIYKQTINETKIGVGNYT